MEQEFYYKVTNGYNRSIIITHKGCAVQYEQGVAVRPKLRGTKLLVLDSQEHAEKFQDTLSSDSRLWKCTVTNPQKCEWVHDVFFWIDPRDIKNWWRQWRKNKQLSQSMPTPPGTIMCDSVTLVERIT